MPWLNEFKTWRVAWRSAFNRLPIFLVTFVEERHVAQATTLGVQSVKNHRKCTKICSFNSWLLPKFASFKNEFFPKLLFVKTLVLSQKVTKDCEV